MIFAAGLGTRLGPLTRTGPKALVEVAGRTLLERVARSLVEAGATRLVINLCPFAERIKEFVLSRRDFGVDVRFSHEGPSPLETGGGLKAARALFTGDEPILLHNVDVLTDLNLEKLLEAHRQNQSLATLFVSERESQRQLLFDARGLLARQASPGESPTPPRAASGTPRAYAFQGVHVIDPRLLDLLEEEGVFSIIESYLRLSGAGELLMPYLDPTAAWIDVGRPASLHAAQAWAQGRP